MKFPHCVAYPNFRVLKNNLNMNHFQGPNMTKVKILACQNWSISKFEHFGKSKIYKSQNYFSSNVDKIPFWSISKRKN